MKPMLACKFDPDKVVKQLPLYGQPKLDGIRMIVWNGIGYSRSLKPIRSTFVQSMVAYNKEILEGKDGELICGDPTAEDCYRRTSSAVMSFQSADEENIRFYIFDRWNNTERYDSRRFQLENEAPHWAKDATPWCRDRFVLVKSRYLLSLDEIRRYEAEMLALGHEGVILRNPECEYKFGRGSPGKGELIKVKQFFDAEAEITDIHELLHNGNEAEINELGYLHHSGHKAGLVPMNTLGAIQAKGKFADGREYTVRIGTGFSDEMRSEYWKNKDNLIGKIVKFKYFEGGVKEAPRFPVFLGLRDRDDMSEQQELF